ncbi:MAG: YegP family protein [Pseudomonadota bacterium]
MAGKFEVYKDKAGEHRFRLKAGNGENILASEGYKSKSSCMNGIASVKKNCLDDNCFVVDTTKAGKHKFNLKAMNHQVIGTSQSYDSEASCRKGIQSVRRNAPDAKIVEV